MLIRCMAAIANAYDYCTGDPIDCFDLDGRWSGWGGFSLVCDIYKIRKGDRGGWWDVASSATFGAAKGFKIFNKEYGQEYAEEGGC